MRIVIISHTEHYTNDFGEIMGWGPTIKEINYLARKVDSITHIAPLHKEKAPNSSLAYKSDNIEYISLIPSGGKSLDKLSLLWYAPINLSRISKALKDADLIQFRAPTGIGLYVLPFLKFFNRKRYWVKYAGNWKDPSMPLGNKLQKWWLRNMLSSKTKVTVNGIWKGEKSNIIPFENPCLTSENREEGAVIVNSKSLVKTGKNFCFVGSLNTHKGVDKIIEAFRNIDDTSIGEIHFVGSGEKIHEFQNQAENLKHKTIFHGFVQKDEIVPILQKCHFILLPSKSEGFPKVIGEAMNYGCIPIVSRISCIDQYVEDNTNGFLISPLTTKSLQNKINESLHISSEDFLQMIKFNYELSEKFTYDYFLNNLQKHIFEG